MLRGVRAVDRGFGGGALLRLGAAIPSSKPVRNDKSSLRRHRAHVLVAEVCFVTGRSETYNDVYSTVDSRQSRRVIPKRNPHGLLQRLRSLYGLYSLYSSHSSHGPPRLYCTPYNRPTL